MAIENLLENHLYTRAAQKRIPISGTFELLPVCNLDCKMCYVKKSMSEVRQLGGLRSADEWIALGRKAVDAGMLFLLLTGGEPFLFPEFRRLYTALHAMGLAIDINSNGTLIDEEQVTWLRQLPPRHVKISLYGASEDSYRRLCGSGEAFHRTLRAFRLLKDAGIMVYSSITVTPANFHELDDMLALCASYDIPVKATSYMYPPHRSNQAHIHEAYRLTPEQAAQATFAIARHNNSEVMFADQAREYTAEAYQQLPPSCSCECGHLTCRAGSCTFWITWRGKMIPCAMMEFGQAPVMDGMDFLDCWYGIVDIASRIATPAECTVCPARKSCYACAAAAYCETGNTNIRPDYPCRMTAEYMRLMKQYADSLSENGEDSQ